MESPGELYTDGKSWLWDWRDLCNHPYHPLDDEPQKFLICYQQLFLQIPILVLLATTSAYYCGKWAQFWRRDRNSAWAINFRIVVVLCLASIPIIRAYIMLSNSTSDPPINYPFSNAMTSGNDANFSSSKGETFGYERFRNFVYENSFFSKISQRSRRGVEEGENGTWRNVGYQKLRAGLDNEATSAKSIDYLLAGTEGLTWFVHLCFLLTMRKGGGVSPRGPMLVRVLSLMLTGVLCLLLRDRIIDGPQENAGPNSPIVFNVISVCLLVLYIFSLIPGKNSTERARIREIGERTSLLSSPVSSYVRFEEEQDPGYMGIAMENSGIFSRLFFFWTTCLMEKGNKGHLNQADDLFDLPESVRCDVIRKQINKRVQEMPLREESRDTNLASDSVTFTTTSKFSLLRLLHKCFGWQFYSVGILKFSADCCSFVAPMLLSKFIEFIDSKEKPESMMEGYTYALLMFTTAFFGALLNTQFTFWMSVVGLKIRTSIVILVYHKIVQSPKTKLNQSFSFGEIVNFMSTDTDRIVNSCPSFHAFWSIPLQLVVTLYLLYSQLGIAFLAGVVFAIVLIPINKLIANKIGKLSEKLMKCKDERVRLTGETLRGIKTIKLNVWEERFMKIISKRRDCELEHLRGRKYLDALCVYFWATTPIIVSILTFGTYALLGGELNARVVFTSMALLNMLIGPLNAFPWVLNGITEAWVSLKRVQRLLDLPDLDPNQYYSGTTENVDVSFSKASFSVNGMGEVNAQEVENVPLPSDRRSLYVAFKRNNILVLEDLNFTIEKGQLVGVIGKVGSGKSVFLDAILGEIVREGGSISVKKISEGFGYVSQNPWVQRGTIRDNILFGKFFDRTRYENTLKACALLDDLRNLPKKDMTGVGESGNTLSGGQKTRIALARAVYADKDIYLLDDIFATLDPGVATFIFQNVILGILKGKTRIVCTHQTHFLVHADVVLNMSHGKIAASGNPSQILPDLEDILLSSQPLSLNVADVNSVSIQDPESEQVKEGDSLLSEESVEKGSLQLGVCATYLKAMGPLLVVSIFLAIIVMQASRNATDLWMSYWATHANDSNVTVSQNDGETPKSMHYYLMIYAIFAVFNSLFTLFRAYIFAYGGLRAATVLHKHLLKTVLKGKMSFFNSQPLGRILNRFSSDTYTVDDSLPFIANILLAQLFGLIGAIVVTVYSVVWVILFLFALFPFYVFIQNRYRFTSRELKRMSSTSLSPLYSHFSETLQGLSCIRALRVVDRFVHENELFLEASQKTQFSSVAASQWLALRLQLMGAALLGCVCVAGVVQYHYEKSETGLIGLAITYILSVSGLLSGVVNAFTETEREMIAVERIKQYLENVPVEGADAVGENPPYAWPTQGIVAFRDVSLRYRDQLPFALQGVSFTTRPAEKIGVVGRTGAGKSSILTCLFRLTEITCGEILIDNVNIKTLQLDALRSRMSIIPQDPFLFSGTVKENIDPLKQYSDEQIFRALGKCKLESLVSRLGGLGAKLEEDGSNLSKGQRQLFCLARAVLHNARVLCIDEATANVDEDTDRAIQSTIKSSFRSATVITIAHRIRTIMHCDRVLVMGDGEILEFDEPNLLIQNTGSYFYQLASQEFSESE